MAESSLQSLLARLAAPPRLPLPGDGYARWISQDLNEPSPFVEPEVTEDAREGSGPGSPVILVTASAAVGKSYLARYLAAKSGNPYWDLSKTQVGTNFFSGTLVKAYGGTGYAEFERLLSDGGATLILDAGDEALVRAGLANYLEALQDLAGLIGMKPRQRAAALILGRPEALEFAAFQLMDLGIPWQRFNIQFFGESPSREFVHVKAHTAAKHYNAESVEKFIDLVFSSVIEAIGGDPSWNNPDVRSFLGYAPVLDSLGILAGEDNSFGKLQALKGSVDFGSVWTFLKYVIDELLEREYVKLAGEEPEPSKEAYYRHAYQPPRQLRMLLSDQPSEHISLPPGTSEDLAREIRGRVESQFRDHPFLRSSGAPDQAVNPLTRIANVAFRDYLAAWAVTEGDPSAQEEASRFYADTQIQPSPILARLIAVFAASSHGRLSLSSIGMIADSVATRLDGRGLALSVEQSAEYDPHAWDVSDEACVTLHVLTSEGLEPLAEFMVSGSLGGTVHLNRSCSDAVIDLPESSVVIGSGQRDFELGPNVTIRASSILTAAESFRVLPGSPVVLECRTLTSNTQAVNVGPGSSLQVLTDRTFFPWSKYHKGPNPLEPEASQLMGAGMQLRQTLGWFLNKSMNGALRYPVGALDVIRRKERIPVGMFDYLLKEGFIERESHEYVFTPPVAVATIRELDLADSGLRSFLQKFILERGGALY